MFSVIFKLVRFYLTHSRPLIVFAILAALFAGITSVVLISIVNAALGNAEAVDATQKWTFVGLVVLQLGVMTASGLLVTHLAERTAYDLRLRLTQAILKMPLQKVERIGNHALLAVLTQDIVNIGSACIQVPQFFASICVVTCSLIYLATLSSSVLLYLLGALAVAVVSIRLMEHQAGKSIAKSRETWDSLVEDFCSLTEGYRLLKLNRQRRNAFLGVLGESAGAIRKHNIRTGSIYAVIASWAMVLYFILIGLILYGFPFFGWNLNPATLISYAITVLFMRSYVVALMLLLPQYAQAGISLKKLESINLAPWESTAPESNNEGVPRGQTDCCELELREMTHRYSVEDEEGSFCLGPVKMTLRPGEVVFVLGNNGSGKTTLIKLLTGLYTPEAGEVRFNGTAVTDENRDWYRQHFSAVFADSGVIRKLLDVDCGSGDAAFAGYIEKLKLAHRFRGLNGKLSGVKLSFGQGRRLALLIALREDRPVYVFDEWDSGQDPSFKRVFFTEIIPELKARGRTVVVVTHEDRYLHIADRIIRLEYGKVETDLPVENTFGMEGRTLSTSF